MNRDFRFVQIGDIALNLDTIVAVEFGEEVKIDTVSPTTRIYFCGDSKEKFEEWWHLHSGVWVIE